MWLRVSYDTAIILWKLGRVTVIPGAHRMYRIQSLPFQPGPYHGTLRVGSNL